MRFSATMAWRAWATRPGRFALGITTLALATAATVAALSFRAETRRAVAGELASFGPNVTTRGPELDAEDALSAAREEFGGRLVAATGVLAGTTDVEGAAVGMLGLDQSVVPALFPWWEGRGEPGLWVGRSLARRLAVQTGESLTVRGRSLPVRAIVTTGDVEDDRLILPLPLAQELLARPGRATRLALRVEGDVRETERRGVRFAPVYALAEADRRILARVGGVLGTSVAGLAALTAIAIGGLFAASVHERRKEAGLVRALGAGAGGVVAILAREALVLAAVSVPAGYALGMAVAAALARGVLGRGASWRVDSLGGVGVALLAVAVGILLPARRAAAAAPAALLRGE